MESGKVIVHDVKDISLNDAEALEERHTLTMLVIFFLNFTKVRERACKHTNLVIVDVPEGVESISERALDGCSNLTTVYFSITLRTIGEYASIVALV